ncbi:MAG: UDP-N-acetylmuramate--alanine ligase [Betaproteobacteria bacterium]|nr:UDP-N-acetylmuramate--alanine ligase [Betaproteobacteria bacterium]
MSTEYLFSYGTMQLESVQRDIFGRVIEGKADQLPGYKIEIVEIRDPRVVVTSGKRHHPSAVHTGNLADQVRGTVIEVSDDDLANSDAYEVADYKRERVTLASGLAAWVYVDNH